MAFVDKTQAIEEIKKITKSDANIFTLLHFIKNKDIDLFIRKEDALLCYVYASRDEDLAGVDYSVKRFIKSNYIPLDISNFKTDPELFNCLIGHGVFKHDAFKEGFILKRAIDANDWDRHKTLPFTFDEFQLLGDKTNPLLNVTASDILSLVEHVPIEFCSDDILFDLDQIKKLKSLIPKAKNDNIDKNNKRQKTIKEIGIRCAIAITEVLNTHEIQITNEQLAENVISIISIISKNPPSVETVKDWFSKDDRTKKAKRGRPPNNKTTK